MSTTLKAATAHQLRYFSQYTVIFLFIFTIAPFLFIVLNMSVGSEGGYMAPFLAVYLALIQAALFLYFFIFALSETLSTLRLMLQLSVSRKTAWLATLFAVSVVTLCLELTFTGLELASKSLVHFQAPYSNGTFSLIHFQASHSNGTFSINELAVNRINDDSAGPATAMAIRYLALLIAYFTGTIIPVIFVYLKKKWMIVLGVVLGANVLFFGLGLRIPPFLENVAPLHACFLLFLLLSALLFASYHLIRRVPITEGAQR